MDFTKYLINDINFEQIVDYIASTDKYKKTEELFDETFEDVINNYCLDLSEVDEEELRYNLDLLNDRPRKCLKYKTPNEVMNEFINEHNLH